MRDDPGEIERRKALAAERRQDRKQTKLSYKDQRELDRLPAEIEQLEAEIADLQRTIAMPGFYERDTAMVQLTLRDLAGRETLLERRIDRWGELESLQESFLK